MVPEEIEKVLLHLQWKVTHKVDVHLTCSLFAGAALDALEKDQSLAEHSFRIGAAIATAKVGLEDSTVCILKQWVV